MTVDSSIAVTDLNVKGSQVRLVIQAPKDVVVHPKAIFERIRREDELPPAV